MGAGRYMLMNAERRVGRALTLIAREESASPATGSLRVHQKQQAELIDAAFAGLK